MSILYVLIIFFHIIFISFSCYLLKTLHLCASVYAYKKQRQHYITLFTHTIFTDPQIVLVKCQHLRPGYCLFFFWVVCPLQVTFDC